MRTLKGAATENDMVTFGSRNKKAVAAGFSLRIKEKKHRLPLESYIGEISASFVICTLNHKPLFIAENVFKAAEKILLECLKKHKCVAPVYLFMPEHCHIMLQGICEKSNLYKCIIEFKQQTGYWFSQNGYTVKWQKDFYDHILRKDEEMITQVKYILNNPLRKGITENWKEYKFKGSTVYNFEEWD